MCKMQSPITLNQTEVAEMNWCPGCQSYSLVYHNACASFSRHEFTQFRQTLDALSSDNYCYGFQGQPHAIIRSSHAYMSFCLSRADVYTLKKFIREALMLHEAYEILDV